MMGRSFVRAWIAAFLFVFSAGVASAQKPVPLAAYGQLPDIEDAAISPSGANIALLVTHNAERQLILLGPDMKLRRRVGVGDAKIRYFDWIGDDQLMLVTTQTEDLWGFTTDKAEFAIARLVPVSGDGEVQTVFSRSRDLVDSVIGDYGIRNIGGRYVAYFGAIQMKKSGRFGSDYVFDHGRPYLYAVDTLENKARRVDNSAREGMYRDWLVGADGEIAVTLDLNRSNGNWSITGQQGQEIAKGSQARGAISLVGLDYDGSGFIYSERDAENIARWYRVPLSGGQPTPYLADVDVDRLYYDERTGHMIGYLDSDKGPVFKDPAFQKSVVAIRKAFADFDMQMIDWSPDMQKVLVRTSGNKDSGSWFVVDLATGSAKAIAYERRLIGPDEVGPISTVQYTASDGLEMDGILTLPPGREAKDLPLVMLPHGGPHSYDSEQFDWWAQAFASRGYAVFQPNFRGSTNRNQQFKLAGYGEWGRKMQTDISDGLAVLVEKGIVDPDRACIVGASYGGYAALAGVTLQQGIYRCAVAVAPVTDIGDMYNEDYRGSGSKRITKAALLDQLGPKDRWDAVSPRRLADRADAPIMLIHGEDDTVVPYAHSYKMADKLKDHGKAHELVRLEGEDHWLSLSKTRMQMLEAAVGFVEKHNPAD